ncbi:chalcone isomerase family protein [Umboniibacter marinipuniceus]|uniref:Chalcone isomerase-like protein n=1 Tax=Umboniibacter marinipuniceus TaxID=569599 RepID=A0A3M0A0X1_9GAMM|nr:chalcone isomerase family protein [Umboniibacter marinipuniceus]RMA78410.1 chalcone isomerase-like protein [Umboniibacter marinipuniceus]
MKKLFASMLMVLFGLTTAVSVSAEAPETFTLAEAEMQKQGEGVRRKFMVPLYDIALYTVEGQDQETLVSETISPMALRIEVRSSLVSTALFTEAVLDGFKKYERYEEVEQVVEDYLAQFVEEIVEGDIYTVFNDPARGVITYRNGEEFILVEGALFKEGMFGIWLGERPVNRRLKRNLLRG